LPIHGLSFRDKESLANHKRVERIWRREGLKVPQKQKSEPVNASGSREQANRTALAERWLLRGLALI
jgi:hypothetical protein